jgi:hypothetical protein
MTFKSSFEMGRTQRKGCLPVGCSAIASSGDPYALVYAVEVGNRATRRVALRNLRKVLKEVYANAR